jgi:hypothetical protein
MPCRSCDYEYENRSSAVDAQMKEDLNDVTALLCDTLNEIRIRTPKTYERLLVRSKNLRVWWEEHQKLDFKRTGKKFSRTKLK